MWSPALRWQGSLLVERTDLPESRKDPMLGRLIHLSVPWSSHKMGMRVTVPALDGCEPVETMEPGNGVRKSLICLAVLLKFCDSDSLKYFYDMYVFYMCVSECTYTMVLWRVEDLWVLVLFLFCFFLNHVGSRD